MTNLELYKQNLTAEDVAKLNLLGCNGCAYTKDDENCRTKTCIDGQIEWLNSEAGE
jgi:hypothetical protein